MKSLRRMTLSTIIMIALVLVTAFFISGTVISQNKGQSRVEEEYYKTLEQEYIQQIRELLSQKGYDNSGVTMTKVIEENGERDYIVDIHHKRFSKLDETKQNELLNECASISFPVEDCTFFHEFLETDL